MKTAAFEALVQHYCNTYQVNGKELLGADKASRSCFRRSGPGPKARQFPSVMVASTLPFLLLASQRLTDLPIDWVAKCLKLSEWDALEKILDTEKRLAEDQDFSDQFQEFLDSYRPPDRAQACTVQKSVAMTYEEIAPVIGVCWQRVQQIEKEALAKLRGNPRAIEMLMEAM